MAPGVTAFTRAHESEALAFLARAPYDNAFLLWIIEGQRSTSVREAVYVFLDETSRIAGVAYFGRQVVLAAEDPSVAVCFATRGYRNERMIVAPRTLAEAYWKAVRTWHLPPRIIRMSQPLFALSRANSSKHPIEGVRVRPAEARDWETIAHNSAKMIEHELGYDPLSSEFYANIRSMIAREQWWMGEYAGDLCFMCNRGPQTGATLQLQGIWTPPHMRGRGMATAALGEICGILLEQTPTLSLYVNGFNTPAIALYERLGFMRVGEFQTLLF